jgi:cob(I)alamin adenosyltransferase
MGLEQGSFGLLTGTPAASEESGAAVANQENIGGADPHEEIVRLEEHIEELAAKIESCRKFILAPGLP